MDADRLMFNLLQQMQAYGTDPVLVDILTEDNIRHSMLLKDCIAYLTDIRGMSLGILMALETDNTNPMDFKHELADLYKELEAIRIEKTFS